MADNNPRKGPPRQGSGSRGGARRQPARPSSGSTQKRSGSSSRQPRSQGSTRKPNGATRKKKPNFAIRRLLALLVLGAVIALAVWGVIHFVGWVADSLDERTTDIEATPPPDAPFTGQPVGCEPDVTDWTFSIDRADAGERMPINFSVTNDGAVPCLIDAGPASLVFTISSGDDEIWSNEHCSSEELMLLLGAGDSTDRSTYWGGGRSEPGCTAVDAAPQPGTYRLSVTYEGEELPEGAKAFDLP